MVAQRCQAFFIVQKAILIFKTHFHRNQKYINEFKMIYDLALSSENKNKNEK